MCVCVFGCAGKTFVRTTNVCCVFLAFIYVRTLFIEAFAQMVNAVRNRFAAKSRTEFAYPSRCTG